MDLQLFLSPVPAKARAGPDSEMGGTSGALCEGGVESQPQSIKGRA